MWCCCSTECFPTSLQYLHRYIQCKNNYSDFPTFQCTLYSHCYHKHISVLVQVQIQFKGFTTINHTLPTHKKVMCTYLHSNDSISVWWQLVNLQNNCSHGIYVALHNLKTVESWSNPRWAMLWPFSTHHISAWWPHSSTGRIPQMCPLSKLCQNSTRVRISTSTIF